MGIENPVHLLFIAAVALVVLGPKRLPELARALGKGIREFRAAFEEEASPQARGSSVPEPGSAPQQLPPAPQERAASMLEPGSAPQQLAPSPVTTPAGAQPPDATQPTRPERAPDRSAHEA